MTVATYAAGSAIDFEMGITTNHQGYLEWWVCDLGKCGAEDLSTECFATPGACHRLNRVPHPSCEAGTDMKCGGIQKEYPSRWYLPCRGDPIPTPENIQMLGGPDGRMRYQLPAGFACERCVVQWYWVRIQLDSRVTVAGSLWLTESLARSRGSLRSGALSTCLINTLLGGSVTCSLSAVRLPSSFVNITGDCQHVHTPGDARLHLSPGVGWLQGRWWLGRRHRAVGRVRGRVARGVLDMRRRGDQGGGRRGARSARVYPCPGCADTTADACSGGGHSSADGGTNGGASRDGRAGSNGGACCDADAIRPSVLHRAVAASVSDDCPRRVHLVAD